MENWNKPLAATAILMLAAFVASAVGMAFDHRTITGVSAWLKPAKFAISTAIFAMTMAWVFRYLAPSRKLTVTGWILAAALVLEVGIIDAQAYRGTTSHFNIGTTLDATLFGIMGSAIAILWLAMIAVLIALFRQRFQDSAWGWSLRLGMLITIIGAAAAGFMLRTTPEQAAQHRLHRNVSANGAHTVGAPDGGPGLPGVGWSTEHGDLRIPHFFGLHAIQVIPFLAWVFRRRRLVFIAAGSYFGLIAILAWQALRGEAIVHPSGATLAALAIWLAATLTAALLPQNEARLADYYS